MKTKRDKHGLVPPIKRKPDTSENGGELAEYVERQIAKERNLYPLRINKQTVIYVCKEKCNEEYAEVFRERQRKKIVYGN